MLGRIGWRTKPSEERKKCWRASSKVYKTSDLQHILSAVETLTEEPSDTDHDGVKCKSRKSVMVSLCPYSEFWKKEKKEILTVNTACFRPPRKWEGVKILIQGLHERSQISALCHGQKWLMQGPYSGTCMNFWSGLWTYQSKRTKFNFF